MHSAITQENAKSQHQRILLFFMPQSHNSFLPANQLLSGSLQMKDCVWFLVQILVLETSLILIRTCWILKHFGQRKDLKMSPGKSPSCLPHERIKDDNLSRVWQLYSLEHIDSSISNMDSRFLSSRCNNLLSNKCPHIQDHMKNCTHRWGKRHFPPLWNFSKMNDDSFFPNFCVSCCVVPVRTWMPNSSSQFSCRGEQLHPNTAASRQSQKQENQCSGEVLKYEILA